ncbi:MAG: aspartate carbamoyltransferase [Candidatus Gracilibacteria bacterium]|nr:aspartate carbamoyltransferase [Candidatus Gracilibacteria bacterium]
MYKFPYKDIISTKQFTRNDLENIFSIVKEMEEIVKSAKVSRLLEGKIMGSLFYEPSTRTRLSFESAMHKLGGDVLTVSDGSTSSLSKGESLEDNAKINSIYCDILTIRHPEVGSAEKTAKSVSKPVINAGDGANQHPTQSLLDVYTILKENKRLDNLHIAIVGDLKYGRTTHSLVYLMGLFENITFTFISPEELKMPEKVISFLDEKNIKYSKINDYKQGIKDADVLYVTRLQKERFTDLSEYERLKNDFILTLDVLKNAKKDITIMHPLPRVNEVSHDVDKLPNAAFFRQAENGLYVRMALLYLLLNQSEGKEFSSD